MKCPLYLIILLLVCQGCSHRIVRAGYKPGQADDVPCPILVTRDTTGYDPMALLGSVGLRRPQVPGSCTEEDAMDILRVDGCAIGAHVAYIIEEYWPQSHDECYECRAEFYAFADTSYASPDSLLAQAPALHQDVRRKPGIRRFILRVIGATMVVLAIIRLDDEW